jgi:predicted RNA polymerase sigma factor
MKVGAAHHAAHHAALRAQAVARSGYGRLLALLAARTGDIAAAEDALADAFRLALETWPTRGAPDTPKAGLYTVAPISPQQMHCRNSNNSARRSGVSQTMTPTATAPQPQATVPATAIMRTTPKKLPRSPECAANRRVGPDRGR